MSSSQEPIPGLDHITVIRQWLYLAANDAMVGKIGHTGRIVGRMDEHRRAANMRHKLSHQTPDASQIEASLKVDLRPWIISGTEWIDLGYLAPCRIICERFEELGADTTPFRRWLQTQYRHRPPA